MPMNPRLLRPLASGFLTDADAIAYVAAVEAADGQKLEKGVALAYESFITGCKADGIWDAIKSSCILAGARTLAGALVPLKGVAPTNNNFVSGDYDRETGLVGDGSTKYLDSNRAHNADGQNDAHIAVYQSEAANPGVNFMTHIGCFETVSGNNAISQIAEGGPSNLKITRMRVSGGGTATKDSINNANGLQGCSRSASGSYVYRAGGADTTFVVGSNPQGSANYFVLGQSNTGTAANQSDARIAYYSIGSSLTLSLLDARVSNLITAIGAAI